MADAPKMFDKPAAKPGPALKPEPMIAEQPKPLLGKAHDEPDTDAAARLRAFEDQHIPDAVRLDGKVERGVGSTYSRLHPARHAQYEALERLVASEQKLAATHAALIQADVEHDEAMAAVARAENDANAAPSA